MRVRVRLRALVGARGRRVRGVGGDMGVVWLMVLGSYGTGGARDAKEATTSKLMGGGGGGWPAVAAAATRWLQVDSWMARG